MKYKVTERGGTVVVKEYGSISYILIDKEDIPWLVKNLDTPYPSILRAKGCISVTRTFSTIAIHRLGVIKSNINVNTKDIKRLIKQLEKINVTK